MKSLLLRQQRRRGTVEPTFYDGNKNRKDSWGCTLDELDPHTIRCYCGSVNTEASLAPQFPHIVPFRCWVEAGLLPPTHLPHSFSSSPTPRSLVGAQGQSAHAIGSSLLLSAPYTPQEAGVPPGHSDVTRAAVTEAEGNVVPGSQEKWEDTDQRVWFQVIRMN